MTDIGAQQNMSGKSRQSDRNAVKAVFAVIALWRDENPRICVDRVRAKARLTAWKANQRICI
jgi:hypothetical protein